MMRPMIMTLAALAFSPLLLSQAWALDEEAQAAKDEGMRLYHAHQRTTSMPYLEQAAQAGDVEAMYYLAEAHRLRHMGLTQAALEWYHQAALHGDPHAMLRLYDGGACELGDVCPEGGGDWPEAALTVTLPKAEAGNAEAMGALYDIYHYLDQSDEAMEWLLRSADAGDVVSQDWLGQLVRDDEANYPNEVDRLAVTVKWLSRAAESGYAPSMNRLAAILNSQKRYDEAWEWMIMASEAGHINGRQWLAACYIDPDEEEICQTERDGAKGWAILLAINEEVPGTSSERSLRVRSDLVAPEEKEAAESMVGEWLNKEPPLSRFPNKFGP